MSNKVTCGIVACTAAASSSLILLFAKTSKKDKMMISVSELVRFLLTSGHNNASIKKSITLFIIVFYPKAIKCNDRFLLMVYNKASGKNQLHSCRLGVIILIKSF